MYVLKCSQPAVCVVSCCSNHPLVPVGSNLPAALFCLNTHDQCHLCILLNSQSAAFCGVVLLQQSGRLYQRAAAC
jgi:hypothetical protein